MGGTTVAVYSTMNSPVIIARKGGPVIIVSMGGPNVAGQFIVQWIDQFIIVQKKKLPC